MSPSYSVGGKSRSPDPPVYNVYNPHSQPQPTLIREFTGGGRVVKAAGMERSWEMRSKRGPSLMETRSGFSPRGWRMRAWGRPTFSAES